MMMATTRGILHGACKPDGTRNAHGSASDGELYFVTALVFASNRWGNDTGIDYLAAARDIVDNSMLKAGKDNAVPLINLEHKLITFTPDRWGGRFTDPSYHVPAFYEVWAEWLGDGRSKFWKECADKSRLRIFMTARIPLRVLPPTTAITTALCWEGICR